MLHRELYVLSLVVFTLFSCS